MDKEALIETIVDRELRMFLAVKAKGSPACRQAPDEFRLHRKAQFHPWGTEALESYIIDLMDAESEDINLMTKKYALMEGFAEEDDESPLVGAVADLLYSWQKDMHRAYPLLMRRARSLDEDDGGVSFRAYLTGELCTFSERTLGLLLQDLKVKQAKGENFSEQVYTHLLRQHGFTSIEAYQDTLIP